MSGTGFRIIRRGVLAGILIAVVIFPVSGWGQSGSAAAKRAADESIGTILYHNRAETDRTLLAIARRLEAKGGRSKRAKDIMAISSLESPKAQLGALKNHISWTNAIDLGALKKGTAEHRKASRFKYRLAAQLELVRVLLRVRGGLKKLRAALPASAGGGIRVIEWTEKIFFDAHDEKLIAPVDYRAFLPVPLRAKKALCVLAGKKQGCWRS